MRELLIRYSKSTNTMILEELGLEHGLARIDIALINGSIHGYEIKSDKDTLERLPHQQKIYNSILDRVTIIVGFRHAYEVIKEVPDWWGIKLAEMGPRGGIKFHNFRKANKNPSINKLSVARLLWKQEALDLLDEVSSSKGFLSKSKTLIYQELCNRIELNTLKKKVREKLRDRSNWRVDQLQMLCGD
ncbi:MAG: sce7726 family protein [Thermodesulfobacteriota bacterium]